MTNDMSGALARLNRDRALYANLLEVLRRGSARVCWAGERGILLYDEASGAWMMSAADQAAAGELLALVSGGCDLFVGHEMFYLRSAEARLGFSAKQICYSALYPGVEPLAVPAFDGTVRRLGPEWAPWLVEHYENDFGGLPYMQGALRRGMLGAFLEGEREPAGFVGFHEEGSIGLLEVLPHRRRLGLGEILQRSAVNLALERGQLAFGQVFYTNTASLTLQRRVGMELSEGRMFWAFP